MAQKQRLDLIYIHVPWCHFCSRISLLSCSETSWQFVLTMFFRPLRPCHRQRRSTPSLPSLRARVRIMDLRVTAAIEVDLLPTSCPLAISSGVTIEETVMSLSSCRQDALSALTSRWRKRTPHFLSKGTSRFCWWWTWRFCVLSPSLVNGSKNCAASVITFLCGWVL